MDMSERDTLYQDNQNICGIDIQKIKIRLPQVSQTSILAEIGST